MENYKLIKDLVTGELINFVCKMSNNHFIHKDSEEYVKWLDGYEPHGPSGEWVKTSNGNEPLPADE